MSLRPGDRLLQVRDDRSGILQPDGDPQQAFADTDRLALLLRHAAVGHRCRVGEQRLDRADVLDQPAQLHATQHLARPIRSSRQLEGDDRTVVAEVLRARERLLTVAASRRVVDDLGVGLPLEPLRDAGGGLRLATDAQREGLEPLQRQPRVERRLDAAEALPGEAQLLEPLLVTPDDRTAEGDGVPVDELGGRVDGEVRAELERLL